eukprot:CAMPEP_0118952344 /NCGR_PEP_ID=MMETSP1169-20130426/54681_1 /TAXON_ID=36882 /ORGANISM="Pyramimonas obovata, Strain CCMP722" /LENGTH=122 /DNA_ID=CAMNT_0006899569 /DNA_START=218 /DNA_END=582 /DNA_ORIENTATION=+
MARSLKPEALSRPWLSSRVVWSLIILSHLVALSLQVLTHTRWWAEHQRDIRFKLHFPRLRVHGYGAHSPHILNISNDPHDFHGRHAGMSRVEVKLAEKMPTLRPSLAPLAPALTTFRTHATP